MFIVCVFWVRDWCCLYGSFDVDGEGEEGDVLWFGGRGDKREVGYEWVMDLRVVIFFLSGSIKGVKKVVLCWRGKEYV